MEMNTSALSKSWLLVTKRILFKKHNFMAMTQRVGVTTEVGVIGPHIGLGYHLLCGLSLSGAQLPPEKTGDEPQSPFLMRQSKPRPRFLWKRLNGDEPMMQATNSKLFFLELVAILLSEKRYSDSARRWSSCLLPPINSSECLYHQQLRAAEGACGLSEAIGAQLSCSARSPLGGGR